MNEKPTMLDSPLDRAAQRHHHLRVASRFSGSDGGGNAYSALLGNGCGEGLSPPSSVVGGCGNGGANAGMMLVTVLDPTSAPSSTDSRPGCSVKDAQTGTRAAGAGAATTTTTTARVISPPAALKCDAPLGDSPDAKLATFARIRSASDTTKGASQRATERNARNSTFAATALKTIGERALSHEVAADVEEGGEMAVDVNRSRQAAGAADESDRAAGVKTNKTSSSTGLSSEALECLAPLYELAIGEIISECERRAANAPLSVGGNSSGPHGHSHTGPITGNSGRDGFDSSSKGITEGSGRGPPMPRQHVSTRSFDSPVISTVAGGSPASLNARHAFPTRDSDLSPAADGSQHGQPPPAAHVASPTTATSTVVTGHEGEALFARYARSPACRGEPFVQTLLTALGRQLPFGESAPMVFLGALAYLARVAVRGDGGADGSVTGANWYRLTTTAALVSAKMHFDQCSSRLNAHFAAAAGLTNAEMNRLELDFLYLIDFALIVEEADVERWLLWMESLARQHGMMGRLRSFVFGGQESGGAAAGATRLTRVASSASTLPWGDTEDAVSSVCFGASTLLPPLPPPPHHTRSPSSVLVGGAAAGGVAAAEPRLFSCVHGAEPPATPIDLRTLSYLGEAPAAPAPPSAPSRSPSDFFRRPNARQNAHHQHHPQTKNHRQGHEHELHPEGEEPARGRGDWNAETHRSKETPAAAAAAASAAAAGGSRWGLVRRMRDVLDVATSVVREQLNILSPGGSGGGGGSAGGGGGEASRQRSDYAHYGAHGADAALPRQRSNTYETHGNASAEYNPSATAIAASDAVPPAKSSGNVTAAAGRAGSYRGPSAAEAAAEQEEYEGEYEDEEGYWDEEGYYHHYADEGYFDEEGYYHYYQDDGYYDERGLYHFYEDEDYYGYGGDADTPDSAPEPSETSQRRPPPLTHSPPDL